MITSNEHAFQMRICSCHFTALSTLLSPLWCQDEDQGLLTNIRTFSLASLPFTVLIHPIAHGYMNLLNTQLNKYLLNEQQLPAHKFPITYCMQNKFPTVVQRFITATCFPTLLLLVHLQQFFSIPSDKGGSKVLPISLQGQTCDPGWLLKYAFPLATVIGSRMNI